MKPKLLSETCDVTVYLALHQSISCRFQCSVSFDVEVLCECDDFVVCFMFCGIRLQ